MEALVTGMRNKDISELLRKLRRAGYEVVISRGGHYKLTHSLMMGAVFTSLTPSDRRAIRNVEAMLKRKRREYANAAAA